LVVAAAEMAGTMMQPPPSNRRVLAALAIHIRQAAAAQQALAVPCLRQVALAQRAPAIVAVAVAAVAAQRSRPALTVNPVEMGGCAEAAAVAAVWGKTPGLVALEALAAPATLWLLAGD